MNGDLKSQESLMLNLNKGLLKDLLVHHSLPLTELNRDFSTIQHRTKSEGLSFLTKTLPNLAKSLDLALLEGQFKTPTSFKLKGSSKLPCFLHGLFKLIFCQNGALLDEPSIDAIKDLRQIGYLFYKYQLPYKEALVDHLFVDFEVTDKDIPSKLQNVEQMATVHYAKEVINEILKDFNLDDLRPKNGPGSVADDIPPWGRYQPTKFYPRLDSLVNYSDLFYYNDRHLFDQFEGFRNLCFEDDGIAKALAVPKDSRGPRLISSEPFEFMAYQQALKCALVPYIESNPVTSGRVNFSRQNINGDLALAASRSQSHATLDLEKASDLVSLCLVDLLFEDTCIHEFLMNSRSSYTKLPDGKLIPLNKFAPMGSALCFPIQAIVFFSLIAGARLAKGVPLHKATRNIFVYGDDIIVPLKDVAMTIEVLESAGLRINQGKSCFTGKFRESCGVDAYDGVNITPIKIKKTWQERPEAATIASWVAIGNSLFRDGYWRCADVIRRCLEALIGKLPLKTLNSPVVGWYTWSRENAIEYNTRYFPKKRDADIQQFLYKVPTIVSKSCRKLNDGWQRLLRTAWNTPYVLEHDPFGFEESFDSAAFSHRYQAILKRGSWVRESEL